MLIRKTSIHSWLRAARLRTLPLAASTIFMGSVHAVYEGLFKWGIFLLVLLTTFCLQILSNLANDYGDFSKGTDNDNRVGPERTVQSGLISPLQMKQMMYVFVGLSLASGILLLYLSLGANQLIGALVLLLTGTLAIAAAVKYTVGKNAFGYIGLGDFFVLLFFGFVGVLGTHYLYTHTLNWSVFMLSFTPGLLATGVLNVNNMRDINNDKASGKNTLVVRMGIKSAKLYHYFLVFLALVFAALYLYMNELSLISYLVFALLPLFIKHILSVRHFSNEALDPQLKLLSISSFLFSLLMLLLAVLNVL